MTADLSIEAVSKLFGLQITGAAETRAAIDRRDSELSIDLTCNFKGITHLFDFFYRTRPAEAFDQYRVDMDQSPSPRSFTSTPMRFISNPTSWCHSRRPARACTPILPTRSTIKR